MNGSLQRGWSFFKCASWTICVTVSVEQTYKSSYISTYIFMYVCLIVCLCWNWHSLNLAGLMLTVHPLPFCEGQMHYFRLIPSYALLWKDGQRSFQHSGLFASSMLPAVSQRFPSSGVWHAVSRTFVPSGQPVLLSWWMEMNSSHCRKLPYLLGWGRFTAIDQICPSSLLVLSWKNKVNIDESLIKLLFFPSLEKLREYHQPQGLNCFDVNIPFPDLTFLLTKSSSDGVCSSVPLDIYLQFDWVPNSNTVLIPWPSKSMT